MAFNINNFIAHTNKTGDYARSDKFEVEISVPKIMEDSDYASFGPSLTFQCEATELPGRNVNMIEYRHHALVERIPHYNTFDNINLTFYCNDSFLEKKFFDDWINSMVPINTGLATYKQNDSYEELFTSTIKIKQYSLIFGKLPEAREKKSDLFPKSKAISLIKKVVPDKVRTVINFLDNLDLGESTTVEPLNIKPMYKCILVEAIPTAISPLQLNWGGGGDIHRLSVNFAYKLWKTEDVTDRIAIPSVEIEEKTGVATGQKFKSGG